jgi:hypothetical protein
MKLLQIIIAALAAIAAFAAIAPRRRIRLANIAEGTHEDSVSRYTDAAITTRHLLYKVGSDASHIAVSGASDLPIGTIADEATAAEELVAVQLLGKKGTKRMVASEAINAGALVYAAASGKVATTGTQCVGVALTTVTTDLDVIEVCDIVPQPTPGIAASIYDAHTILYATTDNTPAALTIAASRVVGRKASGNISAMTAAETNAVLGFSHYVLAAGVHVWAGGAAATDTITVAAVLTTDVVLVNIQVRGSGNPTSVIGVPSAGSIALLMDQNGQDSTTKIGYAVLRAIA